MSDEGIKKIGPNKYQVRVKRVNARTGKQENRKATVTGTRTDARRKRDELRHALKSLTPMPRKISLSAFALSWLEQRVAAGLKTSTIRRYRYCLEHVIPALGDLYVNALSPVDIGAYVSDRIKSGAAGYTVLNELRMLRTMAKDSIAAGCAAVDWCARVSAPKVSRYTKKRPNLLDGQQFGRMYAKIPTQWRGVVMLIATTGLRWGEASALHWSDIQKGEATIIHGNHRGTLITVKNDSSMRTVPVLPEVLKLLGLRRPGLVFSTRGKVGGLHKGSPLRRVLTAACKAAGVPRVTAHGLRRTFNNLARQSTSREVLKSITGHSTDAMVEHYSFVGAGEKNTASRAVAKSMGIVN